MYYWLYVGVILILLILFISLKKLIDQRYQKLYRIIFVRATFSFLWFIFVLSNLDIKFFNSTIRLVLALTVYLGVNSVILQFEKKYKVENK